MPDHHLALAVDIAEIPRLLDWVEEACGEAGVDSEAVFKLSLALDEAVANVIHHAFAGIAPPHRIDVELTIDADRVVALVTDNGHPFDPATAAAPDQSQPLEDRDPGGLGIHLIRRMMDRVEYHRTDGENRLRLEKMRG